MEKGEVTVTRSVSHSSADCPKVDNKSAGLQLLKENLTSEAAVTDWCDGLQVSWAHPPLACCAFLQGFGSKDASLSPVSGARNASHLQVSSARRQADNFYFTLKCELGRDSHQQLCLRRREASPFPCMGMFNIPAHMWCVHRTYMWTKTTQKERMRMIYINSLQWDRFKRAVINVYLHAKFMTGPFPHHHRSFLT